MELVPHFIPGVGHTPKQRQRVPQQSILGVVAARFLRLVVCSPCCEGVTVGDDKDAGDGEEDGDEIEDPKERRGAEVGGRGEVVQRKKVGPLYIRSHSLCQKGFPQWAQRRRKRTKAKTL